MLKGLEKLNGFHIYPMTPIECVYDIDLNLIGYCLLLERSNYPIVMYAKFDTNFDLEEFYPWKFSKRSDKKCVNSVLKNIDQKTSWLDSKLKSYLSVSIDDLKIKDYYVEYEYLKKFDYKTKCLIHNYEEFGKTPITEHNVENKIKNFIIDNNFNYGYLYRHPVTNKLEKFLVGYSFATDEHFKKYNELNLYELIKQSFTIAENVTKS